MKRIANNQKKLNSTDRLKEIAIRISFTTIIINTILMILKFIAGFWADSGAMISDGIHTASDVLSTLIVIIGVNIAHKKSDECHPYGHERMECVAAIILAVILAITGVGIGLYGIEIILNQKENPIATPGVLALVAAIVSIVTKEWMYWYTRAGAKKVNSGALMADAWHHRSDALSSIGALIGIVGARLGLPILDPIASIGICFFIGKAAFEVFKDSIDKMVDKSCDKATKDRIRQIILEQEGILKINYIKTRLFGSRIYVDIEISVDGDLLLRASHQVALIVHDAIEREFPLVKHCIVRVIPMELEDIVSITGKDLT